jgi:RimJ/RimL family protein N-acetyltransferase
VNRNAAFAEPEITLRPPRLTDIDCYHEIFSDPLTHHFIIDEGQLDIEQSKAKLAKLTEINGASKHVYSIVHQDKPVGFIVVHLDNTDSPFISYAIRRSCWRRGLATGAVEALIGLEKQNFKRLQAATHLDNEASQNLLLRSRFTKLGVRQLKMGERLLFEYRYEELSQRPDN